MTVFELGLITLLGGSLTLSPAGWWQKLGPVFEEGLQLYEKADYSASAERFSRAIPASRHACFYNRALCYYQLRNWELARMDFENALQSSRDSVERHRALLALAATQLRARRPAEALRWLKQLPARAREQAACQINLAAAYTFQSDHVAAIEALRRAGELEPSFRPTAELWQAILRHEQATSRRQPVGPFLGIEPSREAGWRAAITSLGEALRIRPGFGPARLLLGSIRAEALKRGKSGTAGEIDRLLAGDARRSGKDPAPPVVLEERPLSGAPLSPLDKRSWESYAGRWELLVLLGIVAGILAVYLRITRQRRLAAPPSFATTIRSGRL